MLLHQHQEDPEDLWDQEGQGDPVGKQEERQMRFH